MRSPRRPIPACLSLVLFAIASVSVGAREVTIAVFDSAAPVVFADENGRAAGIFPDILRRLVSEIGHAPRFVTGLTFAEAYEGIVEGSIDLMPAVVRTPERERQLDFNDEPFLVAWGQLGVLPGDEFENLLDLRDRPVGMMRDGQNGINFAATMASFDIAFVPRLYDNYEEITAALLEGEIVAGVYFSTWFPGQTDVVPSAIVFSPTQAFVASAAGTNEGLLRAIDERLGQIKSDRQSYYFEIRERWLSSARQRTIPTWVIAVSAGGLLIAAALFGLNAVLRLQVRRATASLAESRERYRTVANHAHGWEFWLGPDGTYLYVSPNTRVITGYAAEAFVHDPGLASRIVHEDDRDLFEHHRCNRDEPGSPPAVGIRFRIRRADGVIRWIEHRCTIITGDDGGYRGIRGTNIDITDRVEDQAALERALAERNAMLREIHHRVKNNLQTISSLVAIQRTTTEDTATRGQLDAIAGRVHAMGSLHEAIYRDDRFGRVGMDDYISSIVLHLRRTTGGESAVRIETRVEAVELQLDQALPCGLIVNEAVTNALKHAFPHGRGGTVSVELTVANGSEATLRVRDDGIGSAGSAPRAPDRGIGVSLIGLLARQLSGEATTESSGGTSLTVRFPLPGDARDQDTRAADADAPAAYA